LNPNQFPAVSSERNTKKNSRLQNMRAISGISTTQAGDTTAQANLSLVDTPPLKGRIQTAQQRLKSLQEGIY